MKKFIIALTALLALTVQASAMSYNQAREQALFLTDKMAYELNLTEEQYEAAYEVNLDYLMSINTYDDLYGTYWTNRNLDLSYILMDWQYRAFCAASYFYRPLYWDAGVWHFSIYARYPHRSYFYFGRPGFYATYRGGHGWRYNGGHSWYRGRDFNHGYIANGHGMKDRFDRGDFRDRGGRSFNGSADRRQGNSGYSRSNNGQRGWNSRNGNGADRGNSGYNRQDGSRQNRSVGSGNTDRPQRFTPGSSRSGSNSGTQRGSFSTPGSSFGSNRNSGRVNRESSTRTTASPQRSFGTSGRSLSGQRSTQSRPSNTFTPRSNSGAGSSMQSAPTRSSGHSGGMSHSSGGSNHGGGGGHFGGRR